MHILVTTAAPHSAREQLQMLLPFGPQLLREDITPLLAMLSYL